MTRDSVAIMDLVMNGGTVAAATTINTTNGAKIVGAGRYNRILVQLKQTGGTAGTVTFKAGANPPAFRQGLGDVTVVVPITNGERIVMVESARMAQASGGDLNVDF